MPLVFADCMAQEIGRSACCIRGQAERLCYDYLTIDQRNSMGVADNFWDLNDMAEETTGTDLLELATELTMAWLSNPNTRAAAEDVPAFLQSMHTAVGNLSAPQVPAEEAAPDREYTPAVTPRRSLSSPDHIISMIDGKAYKTLKRHLSGHGLTPAEYRERYGLKPDYPMVAPSYAEMRRGLAKKIGLGRKPGANAVAKSAAKPATVKSPVKSATKPAAKAAAKPKAPRAAKAAATDTAPQS